MPYLKVAIIIIQNFHPLTVVKRNKSSERNTSGQANGYINMPIQINNEYEYTLRPLRNT